MNALQRLGLLAALAMPMAVFAVPAVQVARLQMPAWVQHANGSRQALTPATVLKAGDLLQTGTGGRVELLLSEGSTVKLGEQAQFKVSSVVAAEENQGLFAASLDVLKGAFRFTTSSSQKLARRDVSIRVATVTAGIRGTDLWGKSDEGRDLVCLIEGKIGVSHTGGASATLDQPLQFYVANRGSQPEPVSYVDRNKLETDWAPQTETQSGRGVAVVRGDWSLYLAAYPKKAVAQALVSTLDEAGIPAVVQQRKFKGRAVYLVSVPDFDSESDANAAASLVLGVVPELQPKAGLR
ncbi:FecR domain-containing protein [Leeia aquatica]|uniref:SPOR domain-containing protein n=1 Tax=Leeia aquatica TaxID=2725557 RepID=A0A847S8Q8_9NEIS|nr:FecR domain-containing protein [Leeia aquatica]NLR76143.1 hypothetical protein [Leeia aquatica]